MRRKALNAAQLALAAVELVAVYGVLPVVLRYHGLATLIAQTTIAILMTLLLDPGIASIGLKTKRAAIYRGLLIGLLAVGVFAVGALLLGNASYNRWPSGGGQRAALWLGYPLAAVAMEFVYRGYFAWRFSQLLPKWGWIIAGALVAVIVPVMLGQYVWALILGLGFLGLGTLYRYAPSLWVVAITHTLAAWVVASLGYGAFLFHRIS